MNPEEISAAIEHVETAVERNTDEKLVLGLIARGIWEVARQIAKINSKLAG